MQENLVGIEIINSIGKKAFERLTDLNVPLYPRYYSDTFMDFLCLDHKAQAREIKDLYGHLLSNEDEEDLSKRTIEVIEECLKSYEKAMYDIENLKNQNEISAIKQCIKNEILSMKENFMILTNKVEKLKEQIRLDPLTKTFKYKIFATDIEKILYFGQKRDLDAHICFLKASNFEKINENLGTIAAQKSLIYLTSLLKGTIRQGTRIYRYSHDTFAIIINRTDSENAISTITRILKESNEAKFFYKGEHIGLKLYAGLASHKKGDTLNSITKRAMESLSKFKNNGYQEASYKENYGNI